MGRWDTVLVAVMRDGAAKEVAFVERPEGCDGAHQARSDCRAMSAVGKHVQGS